jgi:hypothetical protein
MHRAPAPVTVQGRPMVGTLVRHEIIPFRPVVEHPAEPLPRRLPASLLRAEDPFAVLGILELGLVVLKPVGAGRAVVGHSVEHRHSRQGRHQEGDLVAQDLPVVSQPAEGNVHQGPPFFFQP